MFRIITGLIIKYGINEKDNTKMYPYFSVIRKI